MRFTEPSYSGTAHSPAARSLNAHTVLAPPFLRACPLPFGGESTRQIVQSLGRREFSTTISLLHSFVVACQLHNLQDLDIQSTLKFYNLLVCRLFTGGRFMPAGFIEAGVSTLAFAAG
ncbi:MAG TPA: hypothetical protein VGH34_11080 [Vicinamibacterales bacterium]|jgi:hypothetical protein